MHPEARRNYVRKLKEIAGACKPGEIWAEGLLKWDDQGRSIVIPSQEMDKLKRMTKELYERLGLKCSQKTIECGLRNMLLEYVYSEFAQGEMELQSSPAPTSLSSDLLESRFKEIVDQYEAWDRKLICITGIVGLRVIGPPLQIGRVCFKHVDDAAWSELCEKATRPILANTLYPDEYKQEVCRRLIDRSLNDLRNRTCSFVELVAEPQQSRELALKETEEALNLIRYLMMFLERKEDRQYGIGLYGHLSEASFCQLVLSEDNRQVHDHHSLVRWMFEFDDQVRAYMSKTGFPDLVSVYSNPQPTEFESTLLRAANWLASAQRQFLNENKFLNVMTCVETLFSPAPGEPITSLVADSAAFLIENSLPNRMEVRKKVQNLYKLRSRLSHGSAGSVLDSHLEELVEIALKCIVRLIRYRDDFKTIQEFRDWLNEQRLGGTVSFPSSSRVSGPDKE